MVGMTTFASELKGVVDEANLLTEEEEHELYERIEAIDKAYDFEITFLTIQEVPDNGNLLEYCNAYKGIDTKRDGLLFAINMDSNDRGYATSTRGEGIAIVSSEVLAVIDEEIPDTLKSAQYKQALDDYLDLMIECLEAESSGQSDGMSMPFSVYLVFVILIPGLCAVILAAIGVHCIFMRQMKIAEIAEEGTRFMKKGSLSLLVKKDTFIEQEETKEWRAKTASYDGRSSSDCDDDYGGSEGDF